MNIIIVGGGITGLTTAIALNKVGINCKVYERAPKLTVAGAGIWMSPNAMKVFEWLGIADKVRKEGMPLDRVAIADQELKSLRKADSDFLINEAGAAIVSIHRAKLQEVLYQALNPKQVFLGKSYKHHKVDSNQVIVEFEDGTTAIGDLLLGADGINSKVRQQLFSNTSIRYSGQTCWRGISDISLEGEHQTGCTEAWSKGIRFGLSPIGKDKVYWFAVAKAPKGEKDEGDVKTKLLNLFGKQFAAPVASIIEHTPADKIIRNDISDLNRLATWSKGQVCLLGDAGHATTPNMGQGGAQGVEDAYYISNILKRIPNYQKAFEVFEKERRKKVDYVVKSSWTFGKLAHGRFSQPLLKIMMKLTPEKMLAKQMKKTYDIPQSFDYLG